MTKIKDNKRFHGGMNTDDSPANLPDGDYVGMRNTRTLSSDEQRGAGLAETLQAEIELLINPNNLITYYGSSIGGSFVYPGFNEITIGTQTWMKKNYDGVYPGSKVYDDNEDNADIYGRLYTHGQIMTAGFCPDGWRVPTEADIDTLLTYLGGAAIAGGKLKETGEQHWTDPNTGATDVAGFRAVPGGKFDLLFDLLGDNSLLWLADEGEPVAPVAINGSAKTGITFVANWLAVEGVTGYYLDVATDVDFTAFVAGFNNKDVGKVLSYAVTGLVTGTDYFYRIRAYNEVGASSNSNTISLETIFIETVTDFDGNVYNVVTIGSQQWTVENFICEHYDDGTPILNITESVGWADDTTGAMCYYNNDPATYKADYGALYNWYAVNNAHGLSYFKRNGIQEIGWRVPSITDWTTLITFLGGTVAADGKLREMGINHWVWPNLGATNESGFTAVGGGFRTSGFSEIKRYGIFWSTLSDSPAQANWWVTSCLDGITYSEIGPKYIGLSIRCVRDVV